MPAHCGPLASVIAVLIGAATDPVAAAVVPFLPQNQNVLVGDYLRIPAEGNNAAIAQVGRTHDLLVLHEWSEDKIPLLRSVNPDIVILLYKSRGFTQNDVESVASFWDVQQHNDWFMHDSAGNIITWDWNFDGVIDGASPRPEVYEYQDFFLDSALADIQRGDWDGLFIDDVWTNLDVYGLPRAVEYADDEAFQIAMCDYLEECHTRFQQRGLVLMANIGWWEGPTEIGIRAGRRYMQYLDMGMQEKFFVNYSAHWNSGSQWITEINALRADLAATGGSIFCFARGSLTDRNALLYGLCSSLCLMERTGRVAFQYLNTNTSTRDVPYFWEYDAAERLGAPLGPATWSSARQLGTRQFQAGVVAVNPTSSSRTLNTVIGMYNIDGVRVQSPGAVLPPYSGMMFFQEQSAAVSLTVFQAYE